MRSDRERLLDILDAIEGIEKYSQMGKDSFLNDELIQSWMTRNIQIIGEACVQLSENFKQRYPDIPWSKIIAMRNIIVHSYFHIDPEEVWAAVKRDIPVLKKAVVRILDELPPA